MKLGWLPGDGSNRWIEPLLTVPVIAGFAFVLWSVTTRHYFPAPFLYNASDSWMDWFNTSYWAYNDGAYDVWNALYPPFSFIFLRIFSLARCYAETENHPIRSCDWVGTLVLHGWYVLNIFIVAKSFLRIDRCTALWRSIITTVGLPSLHGLERGNLIIVTLGCFVLANGPLLKSARWRWLMMAITINMKIYLLPALFVYLIKRRWRWFEGAALMTGVLWAISWTIYGSGTPWELYNNLVAYSDFIDTPSRWLDVFYTVTYNQLLGLFNSNSFPSLSILGSNNVETGGMIVIAAIRVTQASIIIAIAAAWVRPDVVSMRRLVNLGVLLAMMTNEPGAYSLPLTFFLTLTERWAGVGRKLAILTCYILAIPGDVYISQISTVTQEGFLSESIVITDLWITYGIFVRPALTMVIPVSLALVTMADVWRDVRLQGWRNRRRFRLDMPLLTGGGRDDTVHA